MCFKLYSASSQLPDHLDCLLKCRWLCTTFRVGLKCPFLKISQMMLILLVPRTTVLEKTG